MITTMYLADLSGKRHHNIMRDTRNLLRRCGIDPAQYEIIYRDTRNRMYPAMRLPHRETLLLLCSYSPDTLNLVKTKRVTLTNTDTNNTILGRLAAIDDLILHNVDLTPILDFAKQDVTDIKF